MKSLHFSFIIIILLSVNISKAQSLAVNTDGSTANSSALLDVKSTAKGVLVPRMTRTERNAIASPATGLLIFQSGPDSVGFHYYDGSKWTWMFSNANADSLAWRTKGNTGTTDANNFIGTTDNIPFNIRVNNQKSGKIDHINWSTHFGYQAGNATTSGIHNTAIGHQALVSNTTGNNNVAVGTLALNTNTTGDQNTAMGYGSMYDNTVGIFNTAYGFYALYQNKAGSNATAVGVQSMLYANNTTTPFINTNVAVGYESLRGNAPASANTGLNNTALGYQTLFNNSSGSSNTATGHLSLFNNTTGSANTVLGDSAGYNLTTGNNNVFIGHRAGFNETSGSNKLYIANNSTNPPIIYGDFSNKTIGFGTTTPNSTYGFAKVEIASEGFGAPSDLLIRNAANSSGYAPGLVFQHARGTLATPLTVTSGDYLSAITSMNYDGTSYVLSAGLDVYTDGAVSTNIVPTRLQFNTMNTSGTYATRLTIKNDGNVGIGTTTPNSTLYVDGTVGIGVTLNIAGGTSGSPVSLLNQKSYVGVLPADNTNNYYQLPSPITYPGRMYIIRNNSSVNNVNITTAAGLLFAGNSATGGATYTLNPSSSPKTVWAISDGSNWTIMKQD